MTTEEQTHLFTFARDCAASIHKTYSGPKHKPDQLTMWLEISNNIYTVVCSNEHQTLVWRGSSEPIIHTNPDLAVQYPQEFIVWLILHSLLKDGYNTDISIDTQVFYIITAADPEWARKSLGAIVAGFGKLMSLQSDTKYVDDRRQKIAIHFQKWCRIFRNGQTLPVTYIYQGQPEADSEPPLKD